MARPRKQLALAAAAVTLIGSALAASTPAQAAPGDQFFGFNSLGGTCVGKPVVNGVCEFHSTGVIGYGGYGPYTVVAKRNGVIVFQDSCPFGTQCPPEANAPADADYYMKLDLGFGSLVGGTV